jgi:hypothetical protein
MSGLKEVILFSDSEELSSTDAFKKSVGEFLCDPSTFDGSWTHDDWRQTLFTTREKLTMFQSVTILKDDGRLKFQHGDKREVQPSVTGKVKDPGLI